MSSSSNDNELVTVKRIKHLGKKLLKSNSHQFDNQLLQLLNELAQVLSTVSQAPTEPIQKSLVPSMKALISDELLKHTDEDVKISVTCCITQITRIAAPEAPYDDDHMKEIFKLIVAAFGKLSDVSGRCYEKVLTIIDNVAKVRLCLVMLDLQCDDLVIEMFQHFLGNIRSNHPRRVIDWMVTIMTLVIAESEEVSSDLLRPLLDSVRKENQTISPTSWSLGEKVITNCAVKLKPYLIEAVESSGRALDEYAQIVATICQNGSESPQRNRSNGSKDNVETEGHEPDITCVIDAEAMDDTKPDMRIIGAGASTKDAEVIKKPISKRKKHSNPTKHSKSINTKTSAENGNLESEQEPKSETRQSTAPRKRGRKPNSLLNAEEGYDNSWISKGTESGKSTLSRKARDSSCTFSPSENSASRKDKLQLKPKAASEALVSEPRSGKIVKPAQSRKTQDIGNVVSPDESPASHKDNALSRPVDMSKGRKASISKPKTDENTHVASPLTNANVPDGSRSKKSRSRKRSRTDNQDVDSKSVSKLNGGNLNPRPKETSLESTDVRLEKELEASKDAEAKPQISIRRIKFLWKGGKTTMAPESAVAEIETKSSRDNKRRLSATPKEDVKESSAIKELSTKSANPQARPRRSHTTASETRDLGDSLVGSRIKIWWPLDKTFYEGVVDSFDPVKGKHKILYADGEMEVLNLKRQRWEVIAVDVSPDEEQGFALHKLAEASDIAQKIKEPDLESGEGKDINFRSRGRTSAIISKSGSAKSSVKSVDTYADKSMVYQPGLASVKDTARKPRSKRKRPGSDSDNNKNKPKANDIEKEKAHEA